MKGKLRYFPSEKLDIFTSPRNHLLFLALFLVFSVYYIFDFAYLILPITVFSCLETAYLICKKLQSIGKKFVLPIFFSFYIYCPFTMLFISDLSLQMSFSVIILLINMIMLFFSNLCFQSKIFEKPRNSYDDAFKGKFSNFVKYIFLIHLTLYISLMILLSFNKNYSKYYIISLYLTIIFMVSVSLSLLSILIKKLPKFVFVPGLFLVIYNAFYYYDIYGFSEDFFGNIVDSIALYAVLTGLLAVFKYVFFHINRFLYFLFSPYRLYILLSISIFGLVYELSALNFFGDGFSKFNPDVGTNEFTLQIFIVILTFLFVIFNFYYDCLYKNERDKLDFAVTVNGKGKIAAWYLLTTVLSIIPFVDWILYGNNSNTYIMVSNFFQDIDSIGNNLVKFIEENFLFAFYNF